MKKDHKLRTANSLRSCKRQGDRPFSIASIKKAANSLMLAQWGPILDFWHPELWDDKILCCFKPLNLWQLVVATVGNKYRLYSSSISISPDSLDLRFLFCNVLRENRWTAQHACVENLFTAVFRICLGSKWIRGLNEKAQIERLVIFLTKTRSFKT